MTTHSQTGSFDLSALNNLNQNLTQYFWFEEGGSGSYPWGLGAHVTLYPQSDFTNPNDSNYLKGQNILINTDGFSLRNGTIPLMALDNDSLDFNLITNLSQGTYVNVATFGATGAQMGVSGSGHTIIQTSGMQIYGGDGTVELANLGYGLGNTEQGGTANTPYYTLGNRDTTDGIGNWSLAEGFITVASGFASHAEGSETRASGICSHAEGEETRASGICSHAEGEETYAEGDSSHAEGVRSNAIGFASHAEGSSNANGDYSHAECMAVAHGDYSHAEGDETVARGYASHSQNSYTIAQRKSQTAIGEYNVADTSGADGTVRGDYAFIIGNGTAENSRSNALTVGWNGKVRVNADGYSNSQANVQVAVNDVNKLYFGVGSGGVNHGIYSHVRGGWIIYSDASSTHVPADLNVEGLLNVTKNSNTVTIGSQNANFCHIYNTANIPFIFNQSVMTTSGDLGSSTYKWGNLFLSGKIEMDGVLETKYVDLHASSGGASDYDCRLTTSAGSSTGQGLLHINGNPVKDFVKESGTSSSWYYRKWNSGKVEAWRTYNAGSQTPALWVTGWYYKDLDVAIPSGIFASTPNHTVATNNGSDYQYTVHVARATSATNIRVRCVKPNSGAATPVIALYVSNMV